MTPRTIVLTGASDGIGAAAARQLAANGHRLILVGRSKARTEIVAREVNAEYRLADFANLAQVRALADDLREVAPSIDVLVNNAGGVFGARRQVTGDGHEMTFQVNYLAPFLLTERLLDTLISSRATVINTSSIANSRFAKFDISDLNAERGYAPLRAYGNAKLAQILHVRELHRRFHDQGLAAVAVHPGNIATNFSSGRDTPLRLIYHTFVRRLILSSPERGAQTLVRLAEGTPDQDFPSGGYMDQLKVGKANPQANDPVLARQLWDRSEAMLTAD
ncbi:SDR family NAD(P)-dependent oxidoreductase [Deinococcus yavapaiensis]|uniref:Short-subunit dehydrogenase n=1 Tax=Deinococcus yavapaiensis KR-236 TaxID=694435 RepID=A0A318S312_9DEIO|nr:SDR family NAD(P)-dependent oxidoreductase [Deinococcus yavapaiensis]PYE50477.1 short-subunit dehydrogenase [Deinococcus yavapaiensis KR-236]